MGIPGGRLCGELLPGLVLPAAASKAACVFIQCRVELVGTQSYLE